MTSTPSLGCGRHRQRRGQGPRPDSRRQRGADDVTPAVAPTDSQSPTERTRRGSTSSNTATRLSPDKRARLASLPTSEGIAARPPSCRLGAPTVPPGEHHEPADQGDRPGEAAAPVWSAGATGRRSRGPGRRSAPTPPSEWDKPLWRERAVIASGWSESSPMISPRARQRHRRRAGRRRRDESPTRFVATSTRRPPRRSPSTS